MVFIWFDFFCHGYKALCSSLASFESFIFLLRRLSVDVCTGFGFSVLLLFYDSFVWLLCSSLFVCVFSMFFCLSTYISRLFSLSLSHSSRFPPFFSSSPPAPPFFSPSNFAISLNSRSVSNGSPFRSVSVSIECCQIVKQQQRVQCLHTQYSRREQIKYATWISDMPRAKQNRTNDFCGTMIYVLLPSFLCPIAYGSVVRYLRSSQTHFNPTHKKKCQTHQTYTMFLCFSALRMNSRKSVLPSL